MGIMRTLVVASIILAAAVAPAAAEAKRYLVAFREGSTPAQREAALKALGATKADDLSEIGALVAEIPGDAFSMNAFAEAAAL